MKGCCGLCRGRCRMFIGWDSVVGIVRSVHKYASPCCAKRRRHPVSCAPSKREGAVKGRGLPSGELAAQRRSIFEAKKVQKRRSATSCVDPARFRHLRIRSQKVTNIFSWCPILGNLRDYFFMHLQNLWFHTLSENVHAVAPSKSNSAHRDCPKNEVLATKVLALARSGFVSTFVLRLGTSMYSLVWACI